MSLISDLRHLQNENEKLRGILNQIAGAVGRDLGQSPLAIGPERESLDELPALVSRIAAEHSQWHRAKEGECLITARITAPLRRRFTEASPFEKFELVKRQANEITDLLVKGLPEIDGLILEVTARGDGHKGKSTSFVLNNHGWDKGDAR